jgi:hypothetical protein
MTEIQIRKSTKNEEGNCNGCTDYPAGPTTPDYPVWVVSFRGVTVKLCARCTQNLAVRLLDAD